MPLPQVIHKLGHWCVENLRGSSLDLLEDIDGDLRAQNIGASTAHCLDQDGVLHLLRFLINKLVYSFVGDRCALDNDHAVLEDFTKYLLLLGVVKYRMFEQVVEYLLDETVKIFNGVEKDIQVEVDSAYAYLFKNELYT